MSACFRPVALHEAIAAYDLSQPLMTRPCGTHVLVHRGDLQIDTSFSLDWSEEWLECAGLVVTGSLAIAGDLVNWSRAHGPFLRVLGSLRATNVVAGGSEIHVGGHLMVNAAILAHAPRARIEARGITSARMIVSHGDLRLRTSSPHWRATEGCAGFPLSDHLHEEIEVRVEYSPGRLREEHVSIERLAERFRRGLPILRTDDDRRARKCYEEWLAELRVSGSILRFVPWSLIDEAMARVAITTTPSALEWVPPALKSEELCRQAVESDPNAFKHCPSHLRADSGFAHAAVRRQGRNLRHVSPRHRSVKLCRTAVRCDPMAIEFVPPAVLNGELCEQAVRADPGALAFVPPYMRNVELCIAAMEKSAWALWDIPPAIRSRVSERLRTLDRRTLARVAPTFRERLFHRIALLLGKLIPQESNRAPGFADRASQPVTTTAGSRRSPCGVVWQAMNYNSDLDAPDPSQLRRAE